VSRGALARAPRPPLHIAVLDYGRTRPDRRPAPPPARAASEIAPEKGIFGEAVPSGGPHACEHAHRLTPVAELVNEPVLTRRQLEEVDSRDRLRVERHAVTLGRGPAVDHQSGPRRGACARGRRYRRLRSKKSTCQTEAAEGPAESHAPHLRRGGAGSPFLTGSRGRGRPNRPSTAPTVAPMTLGPPSSSSRAASAREGTRLNSPELRAQV